LKGKTRIDLLSLVETLQQLSMILIIKCFSPLGIVVIDDIAIT